MKLCYHASMVPEDAGAVNLSASPDDAVLDFYQSAYEAGANLAGWDRAALDRPPAEWA